MKIANRPLILYGTIFFIIIGVIVIIDAFFIEPFAIEVTHHTIKAPLPHSIKIAHLTDIHTNGFGRREKKLLSILKQEKPDAVFITGDSINGPNGYTHCRKLLSKIKAPLGVWLVRGNWENWFPHQNESDFYNQLGIRFLLNESDQFEGSIWIAGFDDDPSGNPNLGKALSGIPQNTYTIALFHSPAFFDKIAGRCDLALAGHTHGGQIRLPFIPPLWLPTGSGRYVQGWYEKNGSRMYVSRGIGTSILPCRFFCRPEIAFIEIGDIR